MLGGQFNPLSEEQLGVIHEHALKLLEEVGISAKGTPALDLFKKHKADVNGDGVKIPRTMVRDALASVPHKVTLHGRQDKHTLSLEKRVTHLGTGGAALHVIDVGEREPRPANLQDLCRLAKLVDNLDYIEFYLRPVVAQDVSKADLDINKYYASLLNTTKHVMGSAYSHESFRDVVKLGSIIAGSSESLRQKPFISFITCWMRSPLQLDPHPTGMMMEIIKEGLPVVLSSAPMAGSTAPVTMAGCLTQLHAEILSGVVLSQLVKPGAPVICGYVPSVANPVTMGYLGGSAEFGLLNAAAVQLAARHGLPNYCSAGLTDSKIPDCQAGIEKAITLLQVAMAGGNYIHHAAGMLESMLTVSYAQYVIDDDILGMVARVLRGVEVNPTTIAYDVLAKVGSGGNYISEKHTAKNLRKEYFFPKTMDRSLRKEWKAKGSLDQWESADNRARAILAEEQPPKIAPEIDAEVRKAFRILA